MKEDRTRVLGTPFAGLGFDLSSVVQAAMEIILVRVDPLTRPTAGASDFPAPAWGYGLMLSLNRETLGS